MAVGALIITGSYLSFLHIGSWTALIGTAYGRTLLLKLALAGVAMLIGGYNLIVIKPQLDRAIDQPELGPQIATAFSPHGCDRSDRRSVGAGRRRSADRAAALERSAAHGGGRAAATHHAQ